VNRTLVQWVGGNDWEQLKANQDKLENLVFQAA
jgi:hypothetical protein